MKFKLSIPTLIMLLGWMVPMAATAANSPGSDSNNDPIPTALQLTSGTESGNWMGLGTVSPKASLEDLATHFQTEETAVAAVQIVRDDWCSTYAQGIYIDAYYSKYWELYQNNGGDWQAADAGAESYATGRGNFAEEVCRVANIFSDGN